MNDKVIGVMAVWRIKEYEGCVYVTNTTSYYINFLANNFREVYILSDYSIITEKPKDLTRITVSNIYYIKISTFSNYLDGQKRCIAYYKALKLIRHNVDYIYCRVPDLFSWMPQIIFGMKVIMHYVGDTIDATKHNEKWSWLKKSIMISGYMPDYLLTLLASKKSCVFTNGFHLVNKLDKYGIKAIPVISSTVSEIDLIDIPSRKELSVNGIIHLIYIGYIRFAKGIKTLMAVMDELQKRRISFTFDIVGDGEMMDELKSFVYKHSLQNEIVLHGIINDRSRMNSLLRDSDLFIFPSLSEGSPRVVIEAMSQGVPVLSTPVGSVPYSFEDRKNIRLFDFNNANQVVDIIQEYQHCPEQFEYMRKNAFQIVKENYTREKFFSTIFNYEE